MAILAVGVSPGLIGGDLGYDHLLHQPAVTSLDSTSSPTRAPGSVSTSAKAA